MTASRRAHLSDPTIAGRPREASASRHHDQGELILLWITRKQFGSSGLGLTLETVSARVGALVDDVWLGHSATTLTARPPSAKAPIPAIWPGPMGFWVDATSHFGCPWP